jgi:guanylate kinase
MDTIHSVSITSREAYAGESERAASYFNHNCIWKSFEQDVTKDRLIESIF